MKRLVFVGLVLALVCAAGGSASAPTAKQIAAAHKRAAVQKAEKLLAKIPLPAGARPTRTAPVFLREQAWCEKNTSYGCRMGFWRLRSPQAAVMRFMERHALPGYANEGADRLVGRSSWYDILSARQHGWTFVRIDASVPWFYPRSPQEVVPSTVREIDIHEAGIDRAVTSPRRVEQIIRWFDQLHAVRPGDICGPTSGTGFPPPPPLTFSFRAAGHAEVASAVVPAGSASDCDPIGLAIGGNAQRPLKDFGGGWSLSVRDTFVSRVRNLLAGPKPRAAHEAQRLLDAYVPPPGAVRLHTLPKGDRLSQRIPGRLFGKRVDRHRYWLVHAPVSAIEASLQDAKLHGWGAPAITSKAAKHGLSSTEATYTALGFGGRATSRLLNVTAVKAPNGGSFLRADVVVVWHLSAAEREDLPAGVREIDVHGPPRGLALANVTDRTQIRTIVRWFDHLELYEPQFVAYCPVALNRQSFTFTFRGRHGTVAKASVPEVSGVCSAASYTSRGHDQTPLIAGGFDYRVQELLGANWIGSPDTLGVAAARKNKAAREAAALLHAFHPPPGATRIATPKHYGGVLRSIPTPFGEFVRSTHFWRVPLKRALVVAFLQDHDVPAGFTAHCGSNWNAGSSQCELPGGDRSLEFAVQSVRGGSSILRVDSQVVWVYPRSPRERVHVGRVREIDFTAPHVSKRVTDPDEIGRLVSWFNAAPILPPGMGAPMCGPYASVPVTLDFRGAGRRPLAHVSADVTEPQGESGACNPMAVTIVGTRQAPLIGGLIGRVQRELGVKITPADR